MKQIIPAILEVQGGDFFNKIKIGSSFSKKLQIDVADGKLVNNTTIQLKDIDSLPDDIEYEVHLMVADPLNYLDDCLRLKIESAIVHAGVSGDLADIIQKFTEKGVKVSVALNLEDSIDVIGQVKNKINGVLLMAIKPGFSGTDFVSDVLGKISAVKNSYPDLDIEVDGGINRSTIGQVFEAGADRVAVGSAIFKAENPEEAYRELNKLVSK